MKKRLINSYPSPVVEASFDQNVTVHVIRHCPLPVQFRGHSVMPGDQAFPFEIKNKEILNIDVHHLLTFLSLSLFDFP